MHIDENRLLLQLLFAFGGAIVICVLERRKSALSCLRSVGFWLLGCAVGITLNIVTG